MYDDGFGEALYAGGLFTMAGASRANCIARWDGDAWSALGAGVDSLVHDLVVHDDGHGPALFVGGRFDTAGGQPSQGVARWNAGSPNLARWDGIAWSSFEGGVGGNDLYSVYVLALLAAEHDLDGKPALYAGGRFRSAGGFAANSIARWNGTAWQSLGGGVMDDNNVGDDAALLLTPVRRPVADIDGDCQVTDLDLMILLFEWGKGPSIADLDGDG